MLDDNEHDEDEELLQKELGATDEADGDEREKDGRDPGKILYLVVTDVAGWDSEESRSGAHPAEETTPGCSVGIGHESFLLPRE